MLVWTPHSEGRAAAAASLRLGLRLAASLAHWQAVCLSVVVGVIDLRVLTPLQHSEDGAPPAVR